MVDETKTFDFPKEGENSTKLPLKVVIYVPSTEHDKTISKKAFLRRIRITRNYLDKTFGGSTRNKAVGSWKSDNNQIIDEDVVRVESYTTREQYIAKDQLLKRWVKAKLKSWKQYAISVEYDNKLFIVSS